jgi:GST-like protein
MSETSDYVPPKVWTWEKPDGGQFANINRPIAGKTHDKELPVGRHPLQLYSMGTPNGVKITIMLEELLASGHAGAEYDAWFIDIGEGDQFGSGFVNINPNSKIPALVDRSEVDPVSVFETGSILLYLADKFDAFIPKSRQGRTAVLNWLFWQVGSTPYLGGGFGHFFAYAPTKIEYAINRFTMEVKRQLDVLDRHLVDNEFIAGADYSIADMAILPWYGGIVKNFSYDRATEFVAGQDYKSVVRWAETVMARPAVVRGRRVNRKGSGYPGGIRERHDASDLSSGTITVVAPIKGASPPTQSDRSKIGHRPAFF